MSVDICGMVTEKNITIGETIRMLLSENQISQAELARQLNTTASNLSDRIRANSFTSKMIEDISTVFKVNIRGVFHELKKGESLTQAIDMHKLDSLPGSNKIVLELTPEEIKEILLNQNRTNQELRDEIKKLMEEIRSLNRSQS